MVLLRMTLTVERKCCNGHGVGSNQPGFLSIIRGWGRQKKIFPETDQVHIGKRKREEKNAASQAVRSHNLFWRDLAEEGSP